METPEGLIKIEDISEKVKGIPYGVAYISYRPLPEKEVGNLSTLISMHKTRVLHQIDDLEWAPEKERIMIAIETRIIVDLYMNR